MKKKWIWFLPIVVLAILHQDNWWWESTDLVLGFVPIGLAWHAMLSLGAGLGWWLVILFAWPTSVDEVQEADQVSS